MQSIKAFEPGKSYKTRFITSSDTVIGITVKARTAKTITTAQGKRLRISVYDGVECVKPLGSYSMAPIIRAES